VVDAIGVISRVSPAPAGLQVRLAAIAYNLRRTATLISAAD
jgi:hypothetical protein